ncbi:MAG: cupin domain-containing protein [Geminicoccaceae bacterium]
MAAKPRLLKRHDWAKEDGQWVGRIEGKDLGTNATILFFSSDEIGDGPTLHVHTYDEIFIIRQGRARFTIGDQTFDAEAGDILFGPTNIPLSDHFA